VSLAEDGVFVIIATVDKKSGELTFEKATPVSK